MASGLIILGAFICGVVLGLFNLNPEFLSEIPLSLYLLYGMMFSVGLSIGADKRLREILRTLHPKVLLVPVATFIGTLSGVALVSLFLEYSLLDCLSAGTGFGYYSLTTIFVTQYKGAELGTVSLMANVFREIITVVGAGLMVRYFGKLAPICAGGCTTSDTSLPVIAKFSGKEMVFVAIIHAMVLDISVPMWVIFLCTL